ncbi:hypothetical protein Nepgr_017438 [Nepenthes gracilis]|uniref:Uncharacterized protein n=1 Tax=Nepenthes gracilis TaxID=150966 RepID=A0AAD3XS59_NEPGR|nr:hypothetical protein Nepgr_017438 [Nepenthes gracilis]
MPNNQQSQFSQPVKPSAARSTPINIWHQQQKGTLQQRAKIQHRLQQDSIRMQQQPAGKTAPARKDATAAVYHFQRWEPTGSCITPTPKPASNSTSKGTPQGCRPNHYLQQDAIFPEPKCMTTYAECSSGSVGDVYENDEALSGSVKDMLADVATNTEHPELDEGAQHVADHAAGSNGVANSVEFGPIPGVDDSTLESITRITRKYSLAEVVDDSLSKVPSEFPEVYSSPLPGSSVEGYEELMAGAVMPCILERGLVHTLPISLPNRSIVTCIGLILRAAADAVAMLGTALDCSVELLSYFCWYWCLLKISRADEFSLPPFALDAWLLICWMRSGASGEWEVGWC